jgi:hypothetical protein
MTNYIVNGLKPFDFQPPGQPIMPNNMDPSRQGNFKSGLLL